jgi:TPR repeat protein
MASRPPPALEAFRAVFRGNVMEVTFWDDRRNQDVGGWFVSSRSISPLAPLRNLHVNTESVKALLRVLRALAPGLMVVVLTAAASAGPLEDAAAAYRQGDYATALRIIRPLARRGYAAPQRNLGIMLAKGLGVPQDYAEASAWFRKAAEQNDAAAQTNLGIMYDFGHGVERDHAEALKWYRKAAHRGDAEARYNLGVVYERGDGVLQNCVEAAKWYHLAANQGYAAAQSNLGAMFERGEGVRQNYREALKWYRKAAEQGNSTAQYNIGWMYASGHGVPQDDVTAHLWFSLSAAQGDEDAATNRDLIEQRMTSAQIGEAQKLAREWKPKPQGDKLSDMR